MVVTKVRCWSSWLTTRLDIVHKYINRFLNKLSNRHLKSSLVLIACLSISNYSISGTDSSKDVTAEEIDPSVKTLFMLVNKRLSLMDEVANYKWHKKIPIEDIEREQIVLANAGKGAARFNLEAHSSRAFFSAQIAAAKEIQRTWFKQWRKKGAPQNFIELTTVIRPQLIELGEQIQKQYQLSGRLLQRTNKKLLERQFIKLVDVEYLGLDTKLKLLASLSHIKILEIDFRATDKESRLNEILRKGEIRVGTTGDYAPFSTLDSITANYSGIDIDLANDLAKSLGVKLILVATSWPSLASDFTADRFDLAMSGVSINLKRQRIGFFSNAYHSGGKTPIALCSKVGQFNSLDKIDQKGTRVIVNPGGTNYRFAKKNIRKATVLIFNDNQSIFNEIVYGRADVMITDAIEVRLQSSRNKKLCATMPEDTLTKSEKGFWIQADVPLKEYVNAWLHQRTLENTVAGIFDRHLN